MVGESKTNQLRLLCSVKSLPPIVNNRITCVTASQKRIREKVRRICVAVRCCPRSLPPNIDGMRKGCGIYSLLPSRDELLSLYIPSTHVHSMANIYTKSQQKAFTVFRTDRDIEKKIATSTAIELW